MRPNVACVVLVSLAAVAAAEDPRPGKPLPPAEKLTLDALTVAPAELPADVKIVEGLHCVSSQAARYFETPKPMELADPRFLKRIEKEPALAKLLGELPRPTRKASQSLRSEKGADGTVLAFEFAPGDAAKIQPWLRGYLWGEGEGPSARNPETVHTSGEVVVILSFPQGDPGAEWFKARLRRRFGVPASPWSAAMAEAMGRATSLDLDEKDHDGALAVLERSRDLLAGLALAHYLTGEIGVAKQSWPLAEKGYQRALELHDSRGDPLEPGIVWCCHDGLGMALLYERRLDEACAELTRAAALGREGRFENWFQSSYNLACAEALRKRWDASLRALDEAVKANPAYRESALKDEDLADAVKRPEFAKLLAK